MEDHPNHLLVSGCHLPRLALECVSLISAFIRVFPAPRFLEEPQLCWLTVTSSQPATHVKRCTQCSHILNCLG